MLFFSQLPTNVHKTCGQGHNDNFVDFMNLSVKKLMFLNFNSEGPLYAIQQGGIPLSQTPICESLLSRDVYPSIFVDLFVHKLGRTFSLFKNG